MARLSYKGRCGVCKCRRLKAELGWIIDKWLWLIINTVLFKTVIPLRI